MVITNFFDIIFYNIFVLAHSPDFAMAKAYFSRLLTTAISANLLLFPFATIRLQLIY